MSKPASRRQEELEARGAEPIWSAAKEGSLFFMGIGKVHEALAALTQTLEQAGIPYALVGALALNRYGYQRFTVDIDLLLTADGLARLKQLVLGRGYVEKFPGSRGLRDTAHHVDIDVLISGEYPGDGKPKPVRFPDPSSAAVQVDDLRLLPLTRLLELKLASGLSAPHRLRDLTDVLELIRHAGLPSSLAEDLDASVRGKYLELWQAAQAHDPE